MPDSGLLELLALSPTHWVQGTALLAFGAVLAALARHALMLEDVLSRLVRAWVCLLAIVPGVAVGAVLVLAASRHPARAWGNLALGAIVLAAWYGGGALARLVRPDVDRDEAPWTVLAACIALPVGVVAALAFS